MRLKEYVAEHGHGTIREVADESGISYVTVRNAANGMLIKQYDVAKAISEATGEEVTVAELCEL